jgi:hypothetical protein
MIIPARLLSIEGFLARLPSASPSPEKGIGDIARAEGFNRGYLTRFLCLAFLEPEITKAILEGRTS